MRVAVLGNFPLDPGRIPGGVEAVIHNLSVALARIEAIELHLISCVHGLAREKTVSYAGMSIRYLPGQIRLGNVTGHFMEQKRMLAALGEIRPDIVHGHGTGQFAEAALRSGLPAAITVHGILHREVQLLRDFRSRVRRWPTIRQEMRVLREASDIFVIADYVRDAIAPYTDAVLWPVANPVDPVYFDLAASSGDPVVLSIAAVQPRKGLLNLVEAVAQVRTVVPDVRLRLIGKILVPSYAEQLRERIRQLNLEDSVTMLGFVSEEELRREFTSCALFALCSIEESSPVTIAEAMALGKPVVATRVGGVPDLVTPGETGFLVDYGDIEGTAEAIGVLLGDPGLRRKYSEASRSRARRDFHPEVSAARTVEAYRAILARRKDSV